MSGESPVEDNPPKVKLLGERSTGTHLVQSVLQDHFDVEMLPNSSGVTPDQARVLPKWYAGRWSSRRASREAIQDHNHHVELPRNGGWKHAAAGPRFLEAFVEPNDAIVLCLLRHPAEWLRALHRNPFHGIGSVPRDFSAFLRTPWIGAARDGLGERVFANPVRLYAVKAASYRWLEKAWPKTEILRYEDFILNPAETMRNTLLWPLLRGSAISLPEDSARPFGKRPAQLDEYRRRAREVDYDQLPETDRDFVLAELADSPLLDFYPPISR